MKILILGASGLLGNTFFIFYKKKRISNNLKVFFTLRKKKKNFIYFDVFKKNTYKNIQKIKPDIIVNCIGTIKPHINEKSPISIIKAFEINSLFPNKLTKIFPKSKIIHFNTDCVYSGKTGNYFENNNHDCNDIYGISKSLGEIKSRQIMNLRCSIIGEEKKSYLSLVSWFLKNKKKIIPGYINHKWNGLTTRALVNIVYGIITKNLFRSGLFHVVPKDTISKHKLLKLLNKKFFKNKKIITPVKTKVSVNRILKTSNFKFNEKLWNNSENKKIKTISEMVDQM